MERDPTTAAIIGAAIEVSNALGAGFLEKVYRRALSEELRLRGEIAEEEVRYRVVFKSICVGEYVADLVVGGRVIVELKCAQHERSVTVAPRNGGERARNGGAHAYGCWLRGRLG